MSGWSYELTLGEDDLFLRNAEEPERKIEASIALLGLNKFGLDLHNSKSKGRAD